MKNRQRLLKRIAKLEKRLTELENAPPKWQPSMGTLRVFRGYTIEGKK